MLRKLSANPAPGEVLDAHGRLILQGSIVSVVGPREGKWWFLQGLVMRPHAIIDGEKKGHTVPVFFNIEAGSNRFVHKGHQTGHTDVSYWDSEFISRSRREDTDFLFDEAVWTVCPRVVFFRPNELSVDTEWSHETLADRIFRGGYYRISLINGRFPQTATSYMCFMDNGCRRPAKRTGVFNLGGTIVPIFVCDECFPLVHGVFGSSLPATKRPWLDPQGRPVAPTEE